MERQHFPKEDAVFLCVLPIVYSDYKTYNGSYQLSEEWYVL